MYSGFWLYFWTFMLIGAGAVFAAITLLVAWKGGAEIWRMFHRPTSRTMQK